MLIVQCSGPHHQNLRRSIMVHTNEFKLLVQYTYIVSNFFLNIFGGMIANSTENGSFITNILCLL